MDRSLYPMIFWRKPFHIFENTGYLSACELDQTRTFFSTFDTQPWKVTTEAKALMVCCYKKPGKRGIMPADKVTHYNRINIGIFLCFLDLCLTENDISFKRDLFSDTTEDDCEEVLLTRYTLSQ